MSVSSLRKTREREGHVLAIWCSWISLPRMKELGRRERSYEWSIVAVTRSSSCMSRNVKKTTPLNTLTIVAIRRQDGIIHPKRVRKVVLENLHTVMRGRHRAFARLRHDLSQESAYSATVANIRSQPEKILTWIDALLA